jgi:hypothetical protein
MDGPSRIHGRLRVGFFPLFFAATGRRLSRYFGTGPPKRSLVNPCSISGCSLSSCAFPKLEATTFAAAFGLSAAM